MVDTSKNGISHFGSDALREGDSKRNSLSNPANTLLLLMKEQSTGVHTDTSIRPSLMVTHVHVHTLLK